MFTTPSAWAISYVDNALLQFSGEIGLISVGLEKKMSRYSLGGLYGIVPSEVSGGRVIETVTFRQTYRFYEWSRFDAYCGLNLFHILGLQYQSTNFRDAPQGYYPIGNVRGLFNLGTNLFFKKEEKNSFYFEAGINDIWIVNYLSNSREVNPRDHVSMGMGYKIGF